MIWFFSGTLNSWRPLQQGLFMTVSTLTTTGFQNADLRSWASVTLFFLTLITFIGGASGSTAGGIKLNRVALAIRTLFWWFRRLFVSGKVLLPFKIEGRVIPRATAELEAAKNMLIIILSVVTIFIATLVVLQFHLTTYPINDIVFEVVSAFSTCGHAYRVRVSGYADHFKVDLYWRDVDGTTGSDPCCDALYGIVQRI